MIRSIYARQHSRHFLLNWNGSIVKIKIKECSEKAQLRRTDLSSLWARLKEIQTELSVNITNEENRETLLNEMTDTKLALDLLSLHEAQGAQLRSWLRWIEQDERNTKYFLGLEKANCKNKLLHLKIKKESYAQNKKRLWKFKLNIINVYVLKNLICKKREILWRILCRFRYSPIICKSASFMAKHHQRPLGKESMLITPTATTEQTYEWHKPD